MANEYDFHYTPLEGRLSGLQMQQQTEDAINDLGNRIVSSEDESSVAIEKAQQALDASADATEIANNADTKAQEALDATEGLRNTNFIGINSSGSTDPNYDGGGATGQNAIAVGKTASASAVNSVAIGNVAMAGNQNSVAIGANSITDANDTVSVGKAADIGGTEYKRRIMHVADGVDDSDSATLGQVRAVQSTANTASSKADSAYSLATTASTTATQAKNTADAVADTAQTALDTANEASSAAEAVSDVAGRALSNANSAVSTANVAYSTANSANTAASTATTTANNALNAVNTLADNVVLKSDIKVVDVLLNGAKGNGIVDDTTVIQDLIDSNPHSIIYFPKGTYVISETLTTPADTPNKVFLELAEDATIQAANTFTGTWLIELGGTGTPDTSGDSTVIRGNRWSTGISGGRLNCRYKCSGIHYKGISLGYIRDINVLCAQSIGIQVDQRSISYSASDAYLHNIWVDGPQCTPGSKGIVINGTDNNLDYIRTMAFEIGIELNAESNHLTHCHPLYSDMNASAVHNNGVGYKVNASKQFLDDCYSDNFATTIYITDNYSIFCNNFNQYFFTSGSSFTHTFCKFDGTQFSSVFVSTCLNYTANGTTNYGYVGTLTVKPYSGAGFFGLNILPGINRLALGKDDKIFNPVLYKDQPNLNPLYQKTILFTGDSICQGTGDQDNLGGYPGRVAIDNLATTYNYGVGGATIATVENHNCIADTIATMYNEHPDADYVIMEGGINDADWLGYRSTSALFGSYDYADYSGSYDRTTFCGAVEYMFYQATTLFPNAKLGFVIVCKSYKSNNGYQEFQHNYRAYLLTVAQLCEKWGIACLDLWDTSSANPSLAVYYDSTKTEAQNQAAGSFYTDGKHLTAKGYTYMSQRISGWLKSISYSGAGYLHTCGGTMHGAIASVNGTALRHINNTGYVSIVGGNAYNNGAEVWLYGKSHATYRGYFDIDATDGLNTQRLRGTPSGVLTWGGNAILTAGNYNSYALPLSGGTLSGNIAGNSNSFRIYSTYVNSSDVADSGNVIIFGGSNNSANGAWLQLHGKNSTGGGGFFNINASDGTNSKQLQGRPNGALTWDGNNVITSAGGTFAGSIVSSPDNTNDLGSASYRWKEVYAGTGTINTSDERLKGNIEPIPENVLEAWGDVQWYQYQFKDSIADKGENARLHTGTIAQRIKDVFESHNLNAFRYGLLCYDEWEAKAEQKDDNGTIISEYLPAGDRYSMRYEEALCMEAAYQRKKVKELEERLAILENNKKKRS